MKKDSSTIPPKEGGNMLPPSSGNVTHETDSAPADLSHRRDLDAILQDMLGAEDKPVEDDASSNAHSDMSSLLPFGNVIPSDCESMADLNSFSRTNSEIDLEGGLGSPKNLAAECRPDEVILTPNTSTVAHGRSLKSRKAGLRGAGDASVSSNESNSLSSILDSIGWSSIKRKAHHSRGLNKRDGLLDKFFASKNPTHNGDDHLHSPGPHHDRQNQMEVAKYRAIMLFMISLAFLSIGFNLTQEDPKSLLGAPTKPPAQEEYFHGLTEMANFIEKGNKVPTGDNRPAFAQQIDAMTPRDENGKMIVEKVPLPAQGYYLSELGGFNQKKETPLFWIVPKSGGGAFRTVISSCYSLTIASDYGAAIANDDNKELQVIDGGDFKYINVETFSQQGIKRSKDMGLVASNLASIIVSPLLQEALTLFDEKHPAQAFTILRHPIQRAASIYVMLKEENKLPLNARGENIGLEAYARSQYVENNYLTRYLSGQVEGNVNEENLKVAKEMLKRFVIGLADDLNESIRRFEEYFSFEGPSCRDNVLKTKGFKKDNVKEGSLAWNLLQHQNKYDLKLYSYAQELYTKQGLKLFRIRP